MRRNIITTIVSFLLSYLKYFFLTGPVIFSLSAMVFIVLNLKPNFSFGFLSFLSSDYQTGNFNISLSEVMDMFFLLSFVVMFISYLSNFILKKIFNLTIKLSLKFKIFFIVSVITIIYGGVFSLIALRSELDGSFYYIFSIFYLLSLISLLGYFLVDVFSKKMIKIIERKET